VVATDYGGSRDFLDETCGYPVEYKLQALSEDHCSYVKGGVWAEVDEACLGSALRKAADRVAGGDVSMGQHAQHRIMQLFSPRTVGNAMRLAVANILTSSA